MTAVKCSNILLDSFCFGSKLCNSQIMKQKFRLDVAIFKVSKIMESHKQADNIDTFHPAMKSYSSEEMAAQVKSCHYCVLLSAE